MSFQGGHRARSAMQHKARCAIEAPGVADGVRRLAGGMARAYRYQAGPNSFVQLPGTTRGRITISPPTGDFLLAWVIPKN